MKVLVAFLSFVLTLYGCGGGGGGGGSSIPRQPALVPAQSKNAPIVFLRDGVQVGADVRPARNALSLSGTHDGVAVSSGRVRNGENAGRVNDFLQRQAVLQYPDEPGNQYLNAFNQKPTIIIRETTDDRYVDDIVKTVQLINTALPHDRKITISPRRGFHPGSGINDHVWSNYISDGEIFVGIEPQDKWPIEERPPVKVAGIQTGHNSKSSVWVDPVTALNNPSYIRKILAHEIGHALGLLEHIEPSDYRSIMNIGYRNTFIPSHILHQIDTDALYAIFSRFKEVQGGYKLWNPYSLEPWTDTSFHLRGDLGDVSFGASSRNGLIQPWAHGPSPATNPVDNQVLSGSVSWAGRLLGYTANSESLAGAADLTIDIGTLRGRIDFTGIEHWGVHAAPGAIGSGTRWNDGDLRYGVMVHGNSFVQSGGDAGEVTGMFFGAGHEGMGGVVERSDMSAGFAGVR